MSEDQKKHIRAIREKTKEITQSREKAIKYLKDSGISDFVERATKSANSNGKTYR